jgi:uroporphyrin-3 C-methyltransferase
MTDTTKVKPGGKSLILLSSLVSLGAASATGYLYYCMLQLKHESQLQLTTLTNNYKQQGHEYQQAIANLQHANQAVQNRLNQLSSLKRNGLIYQLNELINLANQSLVVYNDTQSVLRPLSQAKEILTGNNDAVLVELKLALANDLEHLNQLPKVDRVMLTGELNTLAEQVGALQLAQQTVTLPAKVVDTKPNKWYKFLHDIKQALFSLVQVTKIDQDASLVLLPEQEILVRQNIQLDLLNARMALLQQDQANWQFSLTNAKQKIARYFKAEATTALIISKLDKLLQKTVATPQANIDATLKALNKVNNLQN